MLDVIRRWRRSKANEARERGERRAAPAGATDPTPPPAAAGEPVPPELDAEQQKRLYEIIREIGYVE